MALLFVDGCDSYAANTDFITKWDVVDESGSRSEFHATNGRFGGGTIISRDDRFVCEKFIPPTGTGSPSDIFFFSASIYIETLSGVTEPILRYTSGDGTIQGGLTITATGHIEMGRGNPASGFTVLGTSTEALATGVWYRLEVSTIIDGSIGFIKLKINENLDIDLGTLNTSEGGTAEDITAVAIGGLDLAPDKLRWDDIVIHNSAGAEPTDFIGDMRIYTLRPTADGSTTESTIAGSAPEATRWESVDDPDVNDIDVTYVHETTPGQKDLYECANLPESATTIHAVVVNIVARADGSTPRTMRALTFENAIEDQGDTVNVHFSADYHTIQGMFPLDPAGGAWDDTAIDAMEIGQELVS